MSTVYEDQERRAAELYGLRPSAAAVCPRVVAGKRCIAYRDEWTVCVCQRHRRALDHGRVWLDANGRHVLTGEPYEITGEDLAGLTADLAELGLRVDLTGQSLWNPGFTVLIKITEAD